MLAMNNGVHELAELNARVADNANRVDPP